MADHDQTGETLLRIIRDGGKHEVSEKEAVEAITAIGESAREQATAESTFEVTEKKRTETLAKLKAAGLKDEEIPDVYKTPTAPPVHQELVHDDHAFPRDVINYECPAGVELIHYRDKSTAAEYQLFMEHAQEPHNKTMLEAATDPTHYADTMYEILINWVGQMSRHASTVEHEDRKFGPRRTT